MVSTLTPLSKKSQKISIKPVVQEFFLKKNEIFLKKKFPRNFPGWLLLLAATLAATSDFLSEAYDEFYEGMVECCAQGLC
jgi:hypothetical protein